MLFIAHFNWLPNAIVEKDINCKKANSWFANEYKREIKDFYYEKRYFDESKQALPDDIYYFLFEDLLVYFNKEKSTVRFLFKKHQRLKYKRSFDRLKNSGKGL